jgi:ElaB/YqjD/DUF883 family membrane-anchored ribosome-binding protein
MSRPVFDAETIGELRQRVMAHNEAGHARTGLTDLKKIFARGWAGDEPKTRALGQVDRHLARLAKNTGDFDETKHRRDGDGKFAPQGRAAAFSDVRSRQADRQLRDENAGYAASQTGVIPETRFSQFGPLAGAVAGVAAGALRGAFDGGGRRSRAVNLAIGRGAARVVDTVAGRVQAVPGMAADAANAGLAAAARGVARRAGEADPRGFGPAVKARAERFAARAEARIPDEVGKGQRTKARRATARENVGLVTGEALDLADRVTMAAPRFVSRHLAAKAKRMDAALAARGASDATRRAVRAGLAIKRPLAAGAVGAVVPGALYGITNMETMTVAGPYLDALLPRRVEKGTRAELLTKVAATPASREALAKISMSGVLTAARAAGGAVARMPRMAIARMPTLRAPKPPEPKLSSNQARGRERAATMMARNPNIVRGAGKAGLIGAAAAAAGGLGAAAGYGAREYYRDENGQFTSKERAVQPGMRGALQSVGDFIADNPVGVGAAAGLVAGALGARSAIARGNRRVIREMADSVAEGMTRRLAVVGRFAKAAEEAKSKGAFDKVNARVERAGDAMRAARDAGPERWNEWNVDSALQTKVRGMIRSDAFWKAEPVKANKRKAMDALRESGDIDQLKPLVSEAGWTRIEALRGQATKQKAAYNATVAGFRQKAADAIEDHRGKSSRADDAADAAEAIEKRLAELREAPAPTTAAKKIKLVDTETALKAELKTAEAARKAANETRDEAAKLADAYKQVLANPGKQVDGISFPAGADPWNVKATLRPLPSNVDMTDLLDKMKSDLLGDLQGKIAGRVKARQDEARLIATATIGALRQAGAEPDGIATRAINTFAARLSGPMAAARRDIRAAGGVVSRAVERKLGSAPGAVSAYVGDAAKRARNLVYGPKPEPDAAGKVQPRAGILPKMARFAADNPRAAAMTGLTAATGTGVVTWDSADGSLDLQLKSPADIWRRISSPKTRPAPIIRPFHLGDTKHQHTIEGLVVTNDKNQRVLLTGKRVFADGREEEIPPLTPLKDALDFSAGLRNRAGGGGGGGQGAQLSVGNDQDKGTWSAALGRLRNAGKLASYGEGDWIFSARNDGQHDSQDISDADKLQNALHAQAAAKARGGSFGSGFGNPGEWHAQLASIVAAPESSILTLKQRQRLLLGSQTQAGLFSGQLRGDVMKATSGADTARAFMSEVGAERRVPFVFNNDQLANMKRAVFAVNETLGSAKMNDAQLQTVFDRLERHRGGGGQPGGGQRPAGGGGGQPAGSGTPGPASGGARAAGGPPRASRQSADPAPRDRMSYLADAVTFRETAWPITQRDSKRFLAIPVGVEVEFNKEEEALRQQHPTWDDDAIWTAATRRINDRSNNLTFGKATQAGLLRKFDEARHARAPRGSDRGGEFSSRAGGAAAGAAVMARGAAPVRPPGRENDERSFFEPTRLGATVGGVAGGNAGWMLAERFMPGPLRRLGTTGRLASRLGGMASRLGYKLGGSMAGGLAGETVGDAAGAGVYRAAGRRAPAPYEPPERGAGEEVARTAGSFAGLAAGTALGRGRGRASAFGIGVGTTLAGEELAGAAQRIAERHYGAERGGRARAALNGGRQ